MQLPHTQTRKIGFGHYLAIKDGNTGGFTATIVDVGLTDFGKPAFKPKEAKCDPWANSHRRDSQGKPGFKQTNWALVY